MNIFEENTYNKVMDSVLGLVDIYDDFQEGNIGFEFKDKSFEVSEEFIRNSNEQEVIDFVRALFLKTQEVPASTKSEEKIMIHAHVLGLNQRHMLDESESLDDAMKERVKAEKWLRKARSAAKRHSSIKESESLSISKGRMLQVVEQMNKLRSGFTESKDRKYQNKWGEDVYVRDITFGSNVVGSIEYLEDEKLVTILRSDVEQEMQGKGIGYNAYKKLISEKIRNGKSIGSDNILSKQAMRIYEKLDQDGYKMLESPKYLMPRGGITSLDREDRMSQRRDMPTEFAQGAVVTAGGYRMKGESIYTIHPSFSPDPCPVIRFEEINHSSEKRIQSLVNPSYVENSMIVGGADDLNEEARNEIANLLLSARNELQHEDNQAISEILTMDNVSVWKIERVSYEDLAEVNKLYNPEIEYEQEFDY